MTTVTPGLAPGLHVDLAVAGRLTAEFTADAGEVVAVLGPNGAGKSTLLHAVAGLLGDVGTVVVGAETWSAPGKRSRLVRERHVGLAFQGQQLFPHLDAVHNVAFGPRSRGASRAASYNVAQGWLDRFGVGALANRRPHQLSGGQAQRVALARALATEPAVLLLDEPFAGLDVGVATELRLELAEHLRAFAGVTLLVTHDALDAFALATRVLVLDDGRVAQQGAPDDVAARPLTEHVARLVGLNVLRDGTRLRAFRPSAVTVSLVPPDGSARLRWSGSVASVSRHGDALRVQVATADGPHLIADVT
ncbi:MAG: ATP-binding cassette domain-containing protein, partial [Nocardioides sp.]